MSAIWRKRGVKMTASFAKKLAQLQCKAEDFIQDIKESKLANLQDQAKSFIQEVKEQRLSIKQQNRGKQMGISLAKGQNLSLTKNVPTLKNLQVGLGWDVRSTDGQAFDLDASAFMVGENGKVPSNANFIFYNQPHSQCGSVAHLGDNLTGAGDGDDETINVALDKVAQDIRSIFITVTIHEAENRKQSFGQVHNAFIRIVNQDTGEEIVRFDLSEDYSIETALIFGEIYRHNNEWKFRAIGEGYKDGLAALCKQYGVNL